MASETSSVKPRDVPLRFSIATFSLDKLLLFTRISANGSSIMERAGDRTRRPKNRTRGYRDARFLEEAQATNPFQGLQCSIVTKRFRKASPVPKV